MQNYRLRKGALRCLSHFFQKRGTEIFSLVSLSARPTVFAGLTCTRRRDRRSTTTILKTATKKASAVPQDADSRLVCVCVFI